MPIALCMTVLNEAASIDELFASIASQTRPPDQIVVVDGGSRDDTVERVARWERKGLPPLVMVHPGANISAGRNTAIASTDAELIAVTDGGVRLEPGWLAALAAAFERAERPNVACGFFVPEPRSVFELALGATTFPTPQEVRPESFLPSSRSVAFTRAAWRRVGGYPEWLDYCEDLGAASYGCLRRSSICAPAQRQRPSSPSTTVTAAATAKLTCGGRDTASATPPTWPSRLACCAPVGSAGCWGQSGWRPPPTWRGPIAACCPPSARSARANEPGRSPGCH